MEAITQVMQKIAALKNVATRSKARLMELLLW